MRIYSKELAKAFSPVKLSFPGEVLHLDRWRSSPVKFSAFHLVTFPRYLSDRTSPQ